MLQFHLDLKAFEDILTDAKDRQIPFATSRALNDVALGVQSSEREGIGRRFILRRPDWILKGVKIPRFSNKNDKPISVSVEMDQGAGRGNIMSKFEGGGTKTSTAGHDVAVPIAARPAITDIVPAELRPKALELQQVGNSVRGKNRTFLVTLKSGKRGIFQRVGPGNIRLLYWLTPSVQLPAILEFYANAKARIPALWVEAFRKRFAEAKATAK